MQARIPLTTFAIILARKPAVSFSSEHHIKVLASLFSDRSGLFSVPGAVQAPFCSRSPSLDRLLIRTCTMIS